MPRPLPVAVASHEIRVLLERCDIVTPLRLIRFIHYNFPRPQIDPVRQTFILSINTNTRSIKRNGLQNVITGSDAKNKDRD